MLAILDEVKNGQSYRTCKHCLVEKPLDVFGIDRTKKTGYKSTCLSCLRAKTNSKLPEGATRREPTGLSRADQYKLWVLNNPDRRKEINLKARSKPANKKKRAAHMSDYRKRNPNAYQNWVKSNPEKASANWNKRRKNLVAGGLFTITKKEMILLYSSNCFYCGSNDKIQADHVFPISRGGRHSVGNLVPCCSACNMSKGKKTNMEWRVWRSSLEA